VLAAHTAVYPPEHRQNRGSEALNEVSQVGLSRGLACFTVAAAPMRPPTVTVTGCGIRPRASSSTAGGIVALRGAGSKDLHLILRQIYT
jgi:hypothetical protein